MAHWGAIAPKTNTNKKQKKEINNVTLNYFCVNGAYFNSNFSHNLFLVRCQFKLHISVYHYYCIFTLYHSTLHPTLQTLSLTQRFVLVCLYSFTSFVTHNSVTKFLAPLDHKQKATRSFETSVTTPQKARCHIPEDCTFSNTAERNLKSHFLHLL
jgi:hypothetical protein